MTLERSIERAVVGAILLEPARSDEVSEWLELDDFDGTAERQAYAAFRRLRDAGRSLTPEVVEASIRGGVTRGTQLADAPYLVEVMQQTPSPDRVAIYGRMVLELSIRRRVSDAALRLRQRAEGASTSDELNRVFADVDAIRRTVEALHLRESRMAGTHSVAPATDPNLLHLMRFPRHEELAAEQAAVLTLVDRPAHIVVVAKWLKPSDFGDEESGALFKELLALHETGTPVDRLTLAWRAAKRGLDGPLCHALGSGRDITVVADPTDCARRVLEQSVRAAVIATSEELKASAGDASINPTTVAYTRLNALWPQQRRLVKARIASVSNAEHLSP
jgi:replicative DNA helicase